MKRFKTLFGLVAGLTLAGSLLAPAALAQPSEGSTGNNSTTVWVVVDASGGVFDAYFCAGDLAGTPATSTTLMTNLQPTASTAGNATGQLVICYTDTKASRQAFETQISANNFSDGTHTIAKSNLSITSTTQVGQTQCSTATCVLPPLAGVGDIGAYKNEAYVDQSTGPWTWSPGFDFSTSRRVQYGYGGIGTILSGGGVGLKLNLPAGTQPGAYSSQITISIAPFVD
jgi:hypothetical protein